jgi:hypothetical protein
LRKELYLGISAYPKPVLVKKKVKKAAKTVKKASDEIKYAQKRA